MSAPELPANPNAEPHRTAAPRQTSPGAAGDAMRSDGTAWPEGPEGLTHADLLGIVEGTIDPERLRAIRPLLVERPTLLAQLTELKADRLALQAASPRDRAPSTLVASAMRAAASAPAPPEGFDAAPGDAAPDDAALSGPDQRLRPRHHHGPPPEPRDAVEPRGARHRRPKHAMSWRARATLAAALLLTIGCALGITAMVGGFKPDPRRNIRRPGEIAAYTENVPRSGKAEVDLYEIMVKRQELAEELAKLIDTHPADPAAPLHELDLSDIPSGDAIDAVLAEIAAGAATPRELPPGVDQSALLEAGAVRRAILLDQIDQTAIGRLAQRGRLHLAIVAGDGASTMVRLLSGAQTTPRHTLAYTATLLEHPERRAEDFAEARSMTNSLVPSLAGGPGNSPVGGPSGNAAGGGLDYTVPMPPSDPTLRRIEELQTELRELLKHVPPIRESNSTFYLVTMPELRALSAEDAGRAVVAMLEQIVTDADHISFFELSRSISELARATSDSPWTLRKLLDDPGSDLPTAGMTIQVYSQPLGPR
jgi:hypothetical protein